jgi:cyclopropane fatty-acyl-phospholipid synthase-like methyltransferase
MQDPPLITVIHSRRPDPYREKVVYTYDDPPEMWTKSLGSELLFQFGLFDEAELTFGPQPGSVGPSEIRHIGRQLKLAGLTGPGRPTLERILDVGCGWGFLARLLNRHFPECPRIDAVNISRRQLDYAAERIADAGLTDVIRLYLCDGQDVDLLPDPDVPYDLVMVRGVYTHFLNDVLETSVRAVASRMRTGGKLVISDTLYTTSLDSYTSPVEDISDRLACRNRKTPGYFAHTLEQGGFVIESMQVLPSNKEIIHWFGKVRLNIEKHFPVVPEGPIGELHEMADSFSRTLAADQASVYSIICRKR